jgi:hypothetical protein
VTANKKGNQPDIAFGVFLIVLSSIALFEIRGLESGTAAEMSTGYVPRALSSILLIIGIAYTVFGFLQREREAIPPVHWKSFLFVVASIASFAFTLEILGLFGATILMTVFASLANEKPRWSEMILFAVVMAAFTVAVFIFGLALPLPIWPVFFGQ